jgi:hypothetical protein
MNTGIVLFYFFSLSPENNEKQLIFTGKKNCFIVFIHEFLAVINHLMLQMAKYSKLVHFHSTETVYFEMFKILSSGA